MSIVETTWQRQSAWSATANRLKRSIARWRATVLSLSVGGAVLETLAAQVGGAGAKFLAYGGAVALAFVPIIVAQKLGRERVERWTRARSASEGLKKAVYRFLMRTPPYDAATPELRLADESDEIMSRVKDLAAEAALTEAPTKALPAVRDADSYVTNRIDDQIHKYYHPRARQLARRESRLRAFEFVLALAAAALGAAQAISNSAAIGAWVAVVTTAGASIAAHIGAERYQHLVIGYDATAYRLESLRDIWLAGSKSPIELTQLVDRCEEAISIENQGWMAAWLPPTK